MSVIPPPLFTSPKISLYTLPYALPYALSYALPCTLPHALPHTFPYALPYPSLYLHIHALTCVSFLLHRVCPPVGPPVRPSVRLSVHPLAGVSVRRNVHPPNHQSRETETRQSCSTRVDDVKSEDENDYGDDYYHENANTNATAHAYLMLLQARLARQRRRRLRRRLHQLEPIEAADGQPGGTTESVLGGGRFGSMRIVRRGSNGRGVAAAIVSRADSDPGLKDDGDIYADLDVCLLYTSPSPRD